MDLLDIPDEIILHILSFLELSDVATLSVVHSRLHSIVKSSSTTQFRFAASRACVEPTACRAYGAGDRLSALLSLEHGWERLQFNFRRSIPVLHKPSGLYDLTAGVWVLGDEDMQTLHVCNLPSSPDDEEIEWRKITTGSGCHVVDFGLAIHEHDLIVILTLKHQQEGYVTELHFLKFSTGEPHPLAKTPVLRVEASQAARPSILIEIVGEHLVLVMTHSFHDFHVGDQLYVFQWKTGTTLLSCTFPGQTYHGVIFLAPKILCLPNNRMNTLDIWLIPDEPLEDSPPRPLKPFLYIGLPHLSPDYVLLSTQCRAEPNPSPSGTPHSHQPFHPKAEDSIVIFTLRGLDRLTMQLSAFTLFVHRRALLDVILQRRLDYAPDAIYAHRLAHVSWQIWGPGSTRLFEVPDSSTSWITTTAGQRCAIGLTRDSETGSQKVTVLDFNPHFVRKMLERQFEGTASTSSPTVVVEESVIEHPMFESPVKTSLPYVSGVLKFETDADISFKAILLDEERLLGITEQDNDEEVTITNIEIMHLGRCSDTR